MASSSKTLTDRQKRDEFHRVICLQYECVAELLREFLDQKLSSNHMTLSTYLSHCAAALSGKRFVTRPQKAILTSNKSTINDMDVTMLTMLLINCSHIIGVNSTEITHIESLRNHRNTIAHNENGRLENTFLFNQTSNDIISLSKSLPAASETKFLDTIDELKHRELVRRISTMEVLAFGEENLQVILIENEGREEDEKFHETVLKFNLTKWAKQISRGINVYTLLKALREQNIIQAEAYKWITEASCESEKAPMLIDHFVKEKSRVDILRLCSEIRASHKAYVADLIENTNPDGKETTKVIKSALKTKVKELLNTKFSRVEGRSETAEKVHSCIDEELGYHVDFMVVDDCMQEVFECREVDGRYEGVYMTIAETELESHSKDTEEPPNIAAMSLEQYSLFVGRKFEYVDEETCLRISSQIKNEFIKMEDFVALSEDELKELFSPCFKDNELKFGIRKVFQTVQQELKTSMNIMKVITDHDLRPFSKPFAKMYEHCEVSYSVSGSLHDPAHELYHPQHRKITRYVIMKEAIRFIAACINGRKNGTIHFGLKRLNRNKAEIIGVETDVDVLNSIDSIIDEGIDRCFRDENNKTRRNIKKCVKPAQIIPVMNKNTTVIEIDVVPNLIYLGNEQIFYEMYFPPAGPQTLTVFLIDDNDNCEIGIVSPEKVEDTLEDIKLLDEERKKLDLQVLHSRSSAYQLSQVLIKQLTRNADYITDEFYPILCAGKINEVSKASVLEYQGLKDALQNSFAVFDFNSSTALRRKAEDGNPSFLVKTTNDLKTEENVVDINEKLWIYCNGNEDNKCPVLDKMTWNLDRLNKLEAILNQIKPQTSGRAKFILLIFQEIDFSDPMIEFVTAVFTRHFQNKCMIISETYHSLKTLEQVLSEKLGIKHVNQYLFHGLDWEYVCKVFSKVFKESTSNACKLPNSQGTSDEITQKEREKWKDIEIVSMEECKSEEKEMTKEERKAKIKEEQEKFYKGHTASWWTFYYEQQGERGLFSTFRREIEDKLSRQDKMMLVEMVEVKHYPGAGGTTLGRHLVWYFSQQRCCSKPYRCCIVRQLTENTVTEIEQFRSFRDKTPRPVIILLDQESHEKLFQGLNRLAYRIASPGELFGLIIKISRVPLSEDSFKETTDGREEVGHILQHQLDAREAFWFEKKFAELEKSPDTDVNSLLAFNFMRNEFDPKFMAETVEKIMKDVLPFEIDILKTLSVISTYETGTVVPESVFDNVFQTNASKKSVSRGLYGMRKRGITSHPPEILNSKVLGLFVCRGGFCKRGLKVICQPLANQVLQYIQKTKGLHLADIVNDILKQTENHANRSDNNDSCCFVEIICSLFKSRHDKKTEFSNKLEFSKLIQAILGTNEVEEDMYRVIQVMTKCFNVTDDAFVGQQLVRFNIKYARDFKTAEEIIRQSIKLRPNNSFLLDTYGQVYRTCVEYTRDQNKKGISEDVAKNMVLLAYNALDKFVEGQNTTKESEQELNMSVYHMEVRTLVELLESFAFLDNFTGEDDMRRLLAGPKETSEGTFLQFLHDAGLLEPILVNGKRQLHAAETLRFLEENDYQVKKFYTVYIDDDIHLLGLRERFERFYCSHGLQFRLKFGYGLKPLMRCYYSKQDKDLVEKRFQHAKNNLESSSLEDAQSRDLLFYLGYRFTELFSLEADIDNDLFRQLLNYSTKLVDEQSRYQRPFLEAFLYFSIFHWPSPLRLKFSNLAPAKTYLNTMDTWERAFKHNNFISTREQMKFYKGKTYFALSKNQFAVIDLYEAELEKRKKKEKEEGRVRSYVYKDFFWREPYVADQVERLVGHLDDTGKVIHHEVYYNSGPQDFPIKTFYPCTELRNRPVTFILAFTWSGLRAFDVSEKTLEENSGDTGKETAEKGNLKGFKTFEGPSQIKKTQNTRLFEDPTRIKNTSKTRSSEDSFGRRKELTNDNDGLPKQQSYVNKADIGRSTYALKNNAGNGKTAAAFKEECLPVPAERAVFPPAVTTTLRGLLPTPSRQSNSFGFSEVSENEWSCSVCTFLNNASKSACDMCGTLNLEESFPELTLQGGNRRSKNCSRCGKTGHFTKECPTTARETFAESCNLEPAVYENEHHNIRTLQGANFLATNWNTEKAMQPDYGGGEYTSGEGGASVRDTDLGPQASYCETETGNIKIKVMKQTVNCLLIGQDLT